MLHILLHRQNKISTERSRVWKTTVVSVIRIHEKEAKEIHQLGAKRQLSEVLALVDGVSSQSALVSYTRWVTTCLLFFLPSSLVAPFGVRVGRRKVGGGGGRKKELIWHQESCWSENEREREKKIDGLYGKRWIRWRPYFIMQRMTGDVVQQPLDFTSVRAVEFE